MALEMHAQNLAEVVAGLRALTGGKIVFYISSVNMRRITG